MSAPNDPAAMAAVHAQCFADLWSADWIARLLAQPGTFAVGESSGFILLRVAGDEAEVLTLAVIPAARRRGIASTLLEQAADEAVRRDATTMFLEVGSSNLPAKRLYFRFGFREVGCRRGYYATGDGRKEDALVLRAKLPLPRVGNLLQLD